MRSFTSILNLRLQTSLLNLRSLTSILNLRLQTSILNLRSLTFILTSIIQKRKDSSVIMKVRKEMSFCHKLKFLIPLSLRSDGVNLYHILNYTYFKYFKIDNMVQQNFLFEMQRYGDKKKKFCGKNSVPLQMLFLGCRKLLSD